MSGNTIPMADMPQARPRRSSIGQAAASEGASPAALQEPAAPRAAEEERPSPAPPPSGPQTAERAERSVRAGKRSVDRRSAEPARSAVAVKRPLGSRDVLLSLPEDLKDRMVNTIAWTQPRTGIRHQQVFIRRAITELCEQWENEFNQGKPFPQTASAQD